jgi:hypothetical protein
VVIRAFAEHVPSSTGVSGVLLDYLGLIQRVLGRYRVRAAA